MGLYTGGKDEGEGEKNKIIEIYKLKINKLTSEIH